MSFDLAARSLAAPTRDETSARLSQEAQAHQHQSDSLFSKIGREADLLTVSTLDGMKSGISQFVHNPISAAETVALPLALTVAMRGPAQLRLAAEAVGLLAAAGFAKQAYDGVSHSLPAFEDAWRSPANFSSDQKTVAANLGPLALNLACMGAIGMASGKAAAALSLRNADIPINNFASVSEGLSRGSQLTPAGVNYLADNGVNTIVDLRLPGLGAWREARLARAAGMDYYNLPLVRASSGKVAQIMDVVNSPDTGSVYVHCKFGSDRTGTVIGAQRRLVNGWSWEDTYNEMRDYNFKPWLLNLKGMVRDIHSKVTLPEFSTS